MIITTRPIVGPIASARVNSVQPPGSVAAVGDSLEVDSRKWVDPDRRAAVAQVRPQRTAVKPAIVFRPHGNLAGEGTACMAAFRPRLAAKGRVAGLARLLSAGSPRAKLALARRKSRRERIRLRAPDVTRLRRHTVMIVLRLI